MRSAFGSTPQEQSVNGTKWIIQTLLAAYVLSTRLYFHAHFLTEEQMRIALQRSQDHNKHIKDPYKPSGALCLQKNCGTERVSIQKRVQESGLHSSAIRRWILSNQKIILNEEVFQSAQRHRRSESDISNLPSSTTDAALRFHNDEKAIEMPSSTTTSPTNVTNSTSTAEENKSSTSTSNDHSLNNSKDLCQHQKSVEKPPLPARPSQSQQHPIEPIAQEQQQQKTLNRRSSSSLSQSQVPNSQSQQQMPKRPTTAAPSSGLKVYIKSRQGVSYDPRKCNQVRCSVLCIFAD